MRFGLFSNGQGLREYEHTADAWQSDLAEIILCEQLGMSEAWVSEHRSGFLPDALPMPELLITKAAALTDKIIMGSAVRRLGFYDPLQVAREAACTDLLTYGRYILGGGSGPCPPGIDQHGQAIEALELVERCWSEREPFDFDGQFFKMKNVSITPKPHQKNMPIAVATTTDRVLIKAAERGWRVLTSQWANPGTIRRISTTFNEAAIKLGRGPQLENVTATRGLYVADTDERAFAEVVPALRTHLNYTRKYFDFSLGDYLSPGKSFADLTTEGLIEAGMILVGSPDTIAQRIENFYMESGGFGQFLIVGGKDWGKVDQRIRSFRVIR